MQTLRMRSTTVNVGAAAYAAGDEISNSVTAGTVVRPTFNLEGFSRGRIVLAGLDVTPASASLVITAFGLNLLIFKTADAPAAVGDNVSLPITGAQRAKAIGHFLFDDGGWMNELGAFTAGASGFQQVPHTISLPLATPALVHSVGAPFEFTRGETPTFTAVLQVLGAWNSATVVNTFGISLDIEAE